MSPIENLFLSPLSTMREAMQIIDAGEMKIGLVVNEGKVLMGTVSDGDIRRAILKGTELDTPVKKLMSRNFISAKVGDSKESILNLAKLHKIYQIPVIDENNTLVDIEEMSNLLITQNYSNTVVLMVGGLGSRLKPLTDNTPKPLLKVGNKPLLEIIVANFVKYGFKNFIFCVNYKSDMIRDYFGDGNKLSANIQYVYESKRMGTAGALFYLKETLTEDFIIMNGDVLTNVNFDHLVNFHYKNNATATMCVREYDFQVPYGVVNVDEQNILSIEEKPWHKFFVNAGIYMMSPALLKHILDDSFFDMPTLFTAAIDSKQKVLSFPIREYWLDIGGINEYNQANSEYVKHFET